ncbi:MAG: helix-turn-helix transcriptional regulator [Oscillospiraceae bacterium]|nr:helix-turn-helix transcriptional regulator [Oscillospiraceae bacterium]
MTLGSRIKAHRVRLGYSQEKMAELVGISRQAVTKWEADQSIPCMENLMTLADLFGVSLGELSGGISGEKTEGTPENGGKGYAKKRLLGLDLVFLLVSGFAIWNAIKIPALIGYSVTGFLSVVIQAAAMLYIPLYLLWLRPRRGHKAAQKGVSAGKSALLGKILWLGTTAAVLLGSFFLCRFTFLDWHGSYQYPVFLLLIGLAAAAIAAIADGRKVMIGIMLGYLGGFAVGIVFGVDGVDPGGGATNNWWVLWTVSFAASILAGVIWEMISRKGGLGRKR